MPEPDLFGLGAPASKESLASRVAKPSEEPAVPEEAIPVLSSAEPSNTDMSNPQPVSQAPPGPTKRTSKRSAAVVGISVMGSRLMGVVREQIFAFMFGTTVFAEAFFAAFRI